MSGATPVVRWDATTTAATGGMTGIVAGSTYRPARTLARVAGALVAAATLLYAIDGLLSIYGVALLANLDSATESQLLAYDGVVALIAVVLSGLYIVAGVSVLAWVRRAVSNIPALTGGDAAHTPNMAVIWWFVPFANLVKPYEIVADVWRRLAATPEGEGTQRVRWWWIGFIVGSFLGLVYARLPMPDSVDAFTRLTYLNLASDVLLATSGVLLVSIILEIEGRARARAALVAQGGPGSAYAAEWMRTQPYDRRADRPSYDTPASASPLGPPQG